MGALRLLTDLIILNVSAFFCTGNSNRIGVILGPAPRNSWTVMFDCGEWRLDMFDFARGEVVVINNNKPFGLAGGKQ